MVANCRDSASVSRPARKFSPILPVTWSAFVISVSIEPYWFSHFAAVFGPTLSMPGMPSELSPASAR